MNKVAFSLMVLVFIFLWSGCEKETVEPVEPPVVTPPPSITPIGQWPTAPAGDFRIGFYNVENLFDTLDDPSNDGDDEFLPDAPKSWTEERYQQKLANITRIFASLDYPVIMGLAEVENRKVLEDLVNQESIPAQYAIAHQDSPDFRGIDVALLYQPSVLEVDSVRAIEVRFPTNISTFRTTRDILQVIGHLNNELISIFVNHWPSRSGGESATRERRKYAAEVLRESIDEWVARHASGAVVVMGDFNDEPDDESVREVLGAKTNNIEQDSPQSLFNCSIVLDSIGAGSYNYRGNWQMLDQIIISQNLMDTIGSNQVIGYDVFRDNYLLFNHPDNGLSPDRTYGGNTYYGGFSDHLPVFLEMR